MLPEHAQFTVFPTHRTFDFNKSRGSEINYWTGRALKSDNHYKTENSMRLLPRDSEMFGTSVCLKWSAGAKKPWKSINVTAKTFIRLHSCSYMMTKCVGCIQLGPFEWHSFPQSPWLLSYPECVCVKMLWHPVKVIGQSRSWINCFIRHRNTSLMELTLKIAKPGYAETELNVTFTVFAISKVSRNYFVLSGYIYSNCVI